MCDVPGMFKSKNMLALTIILILSISTKLTSGNPVQDAITALQKTLRHPDPPKRETFPEIHGPKKDDKVYHINRT